jgi:GxxExxY protein
MKTDELTNNVIGLAIKIHRKLGPGLLESVYQAALAYELQKANIPFEREKALPVRYENVVLDIGFRCDFLINDRIIVECKAVGQLTKIDQAQIINYLKITDKHVGLLINFNVLRLKDGLKRLVNNFDENE